MTSDSSQGAPASPAATGRVLWILIAAAAGLILALDLVEWAWYGQPRWRSMLGQAGLVSLAFSNLVTPRRRALCHILLWLALACVAVSLLTRFWR